MMIDENETFKRFGYVSTDWAARSCKTVVAVCEGCGLVREIQKRNYRDLCLKCACNTPEHKSSSSRTHAGKVVTDEQKQKQRDKMMGHGVTSETRAKMGAASAAAWTDERKEAQRKEMLGEKNHNFGKPMSDGAKQKLREYRTGRTQSEETKDKMSGTRKGVSKSDETKARMKAHASSPEGSKRRSDHMTERYGTKEGRERQSAYLQHQDYDGGEWNGFTDKSRPHLLPIHACTKLNRWFTGCEGHHLTRSLVIFVPEELHKHIDHNLSAGLGMAEMNALALQFAF